MDEDKHLKTGRVLICIGYVLCICMIVYFERDGFDLFWLLYYLFMMFLLACLHRMSY